VIVGHPTSSVTQLRPGSVSVVIETLRLARLTVAGESLLVGSGGSLSVIGRCLVDAHHGTSEDDVPRIEAAVMRR